MTNGQDEQPTIEHLTWAIGARARHNQVSLKLLRMFEKYPKTIKESPFSTRAMELVGVSFSLWRAAFLADRKTELRAGHAEAFLRRIIVDNAISFAADRAGRSWTFNYYIAAARGSLELLGESWDALTMPRLFPRLGTATSQNRWNVLQVAFKAAVDRLSVELAIRSAAKKRRALKKP